MRHLHCVGQDPFYFYFIFDLISAENQSIPVDEHNLYRRAKDPWCPTTHERSLVWEKFAPKLTIGAAKDVIREWGGDPMTITHVITNTRFLIY